MVSLSDESWIRKYLAGGAAETVIAARVGCSVQDVRDVADKVQREGVEHAKRVAQRESELDARVNAAQSESVVLRPIPARFLKLTQSFNATRESLVQLADLMQHQVHETELQDFIEQTKAKGLWHTHDQLATLISNTFFICHERPPEPSTDVTGHSSQPSESAVRQD